MNTRLWHQNYMPIQSVLFNQTLYEKWGGLEEDMDQLEDWNLWTRYTLENDFVFVQKCTSKYRVPVNFRLRKMRQERLDIAYQAAVKKQKEMIFKSDPRTIFESIDSYIRSQAVLMVTQGQIWSWAERFAATRWLIRRRGQFRRIWVLLKKRLNA